MAHTVTIPTMASTGYARAAGLLSKLAAKAQRQAERHEQRVVIRSDERLYAVRQPGTRHQSKVMLTPCEVLHYVERGFIVTQA